MLGQFKLGEKGCKHVIAVVQLQTTINKINNLEQTSKLIEKTKNKNVKVIPI